MHPLSTQSEYYFTFISTLLQASISTSPLRIDNGFPWIFKSYVHTPVLACRQHSRPAGSTMISLVSVFILWFNVTTIVLVDSFKIQKSAYAFLHPGLRSHSFFPPMALINSTTIFPPSMTGLEVVAGSVWVNPCHAQHQNNTTPMIFVFTGYED